VSDWRAERDAALLRLEREKSAPLRAEVAEVLCQLAQEAPRDAASEFSAVVVRLLSDVQPEVKCAGLALAAEVLPAGEARDALVRHLDDRVARVRVEAAGRLADRPVPESRGAFAAALEDEVLEVRFEAARGLAALRHSAGLAVLVEALGSPELRFRAAGALAQLGDPAAVPHLERTFGAWFLPAFDRTQLAGALAKLGIAAGLEHLSKRALRPWSVDRALALELLGEVKAPGARALLEACLGNPRDASRGAAARALGRLGDLGAEGLLLRLIDDVSLGNELRLDLAEALLRLGSGPGRERLRALRLSEVDAQAELVAMLEEGV
jgi:HEAT repeat protein